MLLNLTLTLTHTLTHTLTLTLTHTLALSSSVAGIDEEDAAASPEGLALDAWVGATLPAMDSKRRTLIVRSLLGEDLRLDHLRLAATLPHSFKALADMLHLDGQLTHGEKIQLAASLISQVTSM